MALLEELLLVQVLDHLLVSELNIAALERLAVAPPTTRQPRISLLLWSLRMNQISDWIPASNKPFALPLMPSQAVGNCFPERLQAAMRRFVTGSVLTS